MIVQLKERYIDTDSICFISDIYLKPSTSVTSYAFWILLKGREKEIVFEWDQKLYDGETPESLRQKVDAIRNKLARKISQNVENLDAVIDLRKRDTDTGKPIKRLTVKRV